MKLVWPIAVVLIVASGLIGLAASAAPTPSPWERPAAALAEQIAGILGPGQAHLTVRKMSTIPNDEIPAIRLQLEQDLKAHGVLASGAESANSIRVTLSENQRERLWVAEVIEGSETRVTMVRVASAAQEKAQTHGGITLRKQTVFTTREAALAALETADGLVAVESEEIVIFNHTTEGWREQKRVTIAQSRPLARDQRAIVLPSIAGKGFEAYLPGISCSGNYEPVQPAGDWSVHCRESDDPWPIVQQPALQAPAAATPSDSPVSLKAFYNAARNYFTGVVTPSVDVDLPPFYSAAVIPRPASAAALLIGGIDGKVQILEGASLMPGIPTDGSSSVGLKPVTGTRDWGSDFAALNSGCGAGAQVIASGSGEAASDSLRAYDLPAQEAVAASAPLAMDGTVTALWTAPDGKSVLAVVRSAADQYEVDRVTASCNE
jgi:hypothetical protein